MSVGKKCIATTDFQETAGLSEPGKFEQLKSLPSREGFFLGSVP